MTGRMLVECGWCGVSLGDQEVPAARHGTVSHGICAACLLVLKRDLPLPQSFLEKLPVPVLLLNEGGVVLQVNGSACSLLGKSEAELVGQRQGNVLDCPNAQGGRCGETPSCLDCELRACVQATFDSGLPVEGRLVRREMVMDGRLREVDMKLSILRSGGVVVLRVDGIEPR